MDTGNSTGHWGRGWNTQGEGAAGAWVLYSPGMVPHACAPGEETSVFLLAMKGALEGEGQVRPGY